MRDPQSKEVRVIDFDLPETSLTLVEINRLSCERRSIKCQIQSLREQNETLSTDSYGGSQSY